MKGNRYGSSPILWGGSWVYPPYSAGPSYNTRLQAGPAADTDTASLIRELAKAINGEYNAIRTYEWLAREAPDEEFRKIISDIKQDEEHHFRLFSSYYSQLTGGRKPEIKAGPLPESFVKGVEESIKDELEDSKSYQRLSEIVPLPLRRGLINASHDEQRHATWFSYIWNRTR
ncbi:Uncharacterized conserved protein [Chlamydia abortus]|uniref:Ferritin family protein n=1 Tax=Paenibacillus residui TaxID=629724 RepID=A0ABW3DII1_9BACL|nr:ferritin-like domain-containing protein [Paenibacillus sp. 32O-W]SHE14649.1 Uncharacterized conserved protein [Chlamydia abortus]